ncbi:hypothetical protein HYW21_09260 [Candidatus Woesearchaeota archaeon]|nr:hypothetical protein [Candidatus Woesearchaeota archaeon]
MDTSILKEIGLTGAEITVFLTSIELGLSSAGPLVEKSGLQNAVVHRTLHSMIEKGLMTYILEGKRRYYQTVKPEVLLTVLEEKKERLQKILPELKTKYHFAKKKSQATIYQGIKGVKEILYQMLDTHAKQYTAYGGAQISDDMLGTYFWESFHKRRMKKHIHAKLVFHHSLRWWGKELMKKGISKVRYTSKDFEELTETVICGDRVGIIIYTEKPFGFLLEEKAAANSYNKFFEILWKNSKAE